MSASQPPRNKGTHYLVFFTLSFLMIIGLGMMYIEDVQTGVGLVVDQAVAWFSQP